MPRLGARCASGASRPVNMSVIIRPQHREGRILTQMQEGDARKTRRCLGGIHGPWVTPDYLRVLRASVALSALDSFFPAHQKSSQREPRPYPIATTRRVPDPVGKTDRRDRRPQRNTKHEFPARTLCNNVWISRTGVLRVCKRHGGGDGRARNANFPQRPYAWSAGPGCSGLHSTARPGGGRARNANFPQRPYAWSAGPGCSGSALDGTAGVVAGRGMRSFRKDPMQPCVDRQDRDAPGLHSSSPPGWSQGAECDLHATTP
jgi:hypothetical protein